MQCHVSSSLRMECSGAGASILKTHRYRPLPIRGRKRTVCSLRGIASGTLIARGYEWAGREWGRIDKYAFAVIIVAGATSYYGLYLSQVAVFQMVMYGVIEIR